MSKPPLKPLMIKLTKAIVQAKAPGKSKPRFTKLPPPPKLKVIKGYTLKPNSPRRKVTLPTRA